MHIEHAVRSDYAQILALNAEAMPHVNLIDARELEELHEQATVLLVARDEQQRVAGFLLALPETASYGSANFRFFQERFDRFAYVDRIVVSPEHRGLGIGARLYAGLFESAGDQLVTCEVNLEPPNPGSMSFHEALGFARVGEQDTEGGSKRVALMAREPHRA